MNDITYILGYYCIKYEDDLDGGQYPRVWVNNVCLLADLWFVDKSAIKSLRQKYLAINNMNILLNRLHKGLLK